MTERFFLRRKQHLDSRAIAQLLAQGRQKRADGISVRASTNNLVTARLGLIVPKRLLHSAVKRNRFKREVREWFRLRQHLLIGQDILVRLASPMPASARCADVLNKILPGDQRG